MSHSPSKLQIYRGAMSKCEHTLYRNIHVIHSWIMYSHREVNTALFGFLGYHTMMGTVFFFPEQTRTRNLRSLMQVFPVM